MSCSSLYFNRGTCGKQQGGARQKIFLLPAALFAVSVKESAPTIRMDINKNGQVMTARTEWSGASAQYISNLQLSAFSHYYFDAKRNGIILTRETSDGDVTTINTTLIVSIGVDNSELSARLTDAKIIGSEYSVIFADNNGGVYIINGLFLTNISFTRGESENAGSGYELTLFAEDAECHYIDNIGYYSNTTFCRGVIGDLVLN